MAFGMTDPMLQCSRKSHAEVVTGGTSTVSRVAAGEPANEEPVDIRYGGNRTCLGARSPTRRCQIERRWVERDLHALRSHQQQKPAAPWKTIAVGGTRNHHDYSPEVRAYV